MMNGLYALGLVFAFLWGLILLHDLRGKRKENANSMPLHEEIGVESSKKEERSLKNDGQTDIIIVGAGVAGSALAYALGKDGRRVHVFERDLTEPNRMVGELLQPGGYIKLMELGLEDCLNEIDAQRVIGYAIYKDGKQIRVPYPVEGYDSDLAGRSFHNGRFVQRMREMAASLPNVKLEQGTVVSIIKEKETIKGVRYKKSTGEGKELAAYAPLTIVCDGSFSNLRRSLSSSKVDVLSYSVGLTLENCELPFANHVHMIIANPSPMALYRISSTEIRCLIDLSGQKVPSVSNGDMALYLKTIIAPQVPPEVQNAFIAAIEKGNIRTMPCRSMPADPFPTPGAIMIGDAFNMRHPISGVGMTVALSDVVMLRDLLKPLRYLNNAVAVCNDLQSFYTLRKIFSASPDQAKQEMRQACFDFLALGNVTSKGMMDLLAGLNPQPSSLILHCIAIGIYGVGRLLLPFPSPKRLWLAARILSEISNIVLPAARA
ncbi:hypothetical protein Nepgr_019760 [Nepenthes gracilis]|uniref:Squalene monooxygenase n=1 Tax=Nepenthes gracilis TaxID=150966 RepID=A0AAD3SVR9_NEPGR|nr:hypothetical protein Nepgr_019760 [Nepenthes gracilis]